MRRFGRRCSPCENVTMFDFVPEYAINTDEVFRRGGRNFGDEQFALVRCPACGRIYLIDQSADIVYPDPKDLGARWPAARSPFPCAGCGSPLPEHPWVGQGAPEDMRVKWDQLRDSRWAWAASVEVMIRNRKQMERDG